MSTTRTTLATTNARIDSLEAKLDRILAAIEPTAPAKTRVSAPKAEPKATKVLTRKRAAALRTRYAKYSGLTRAQMLEAGLKGYHLPTGALRASLSA